MMKREYKLEELVDINKLQALLDSLYEVAKIPSAIIDVNSKILTATAWQDVCTRFHRINPETKAKCIKSDARIIDKLSVGLPPVIYTCPNGLIDSATPVIVDGKHIANVFTGQLFLEKPDINFFRKQAQKCGFNEKDYIEAVKRVPVISREKLGQNLDFLAHFTEMLAEQGLKELQQQKLAKALGESEKRFRQLYENAPLSYQSLDEEGNFVEVNQAWLSELGYSREEVIGKWFGDFLTPESQYHFKENFPCFKAAGETSGIEFRMVRKDGTQIIVEFNGKIGYEPQGQFKQTHCILQNITKRKQAEEKIKESERRFRETLTNLNLIAVQLDTEGNIIFANDFLLESTGWKCNEVIGQNWINLFIPPESREEIRELHRKNCLNSEFNTNYINEILTKKGEKRLISWNNSRLLDPKENLIGITSIGEDITERKQAEEALRESEEKYSSLFKNNHSIMLLIDPQTGNIVDANPSACTFYGYSRAELTQKKIQEINLLPGEEVQQEMNRAKLEQRKRFFFRHRLASGKIRDVEVYSGPITVQGKPLLYSIIHDITGRKQAEEALRESEEKYRSLFENSRVGIGLGKANQVVSANTATLDIFGYDTLEEFARIPILDHVAPESKDKIKEIRKQFEQGETASQKIEYRIIRGDGEIRDLEASFTPITLAGERYNMNTFIDITKRKQAEAEILQRNQELKSLATISEIANSSLELEQLMEDVLPEVSRAINAESVIVFLCEDTGEKMALQSFYGHIPDIGEEEEVLEIGKCLCGLAVSEKRSIYSEDIYSDPRCTLRTCKDAGLTSIAATPLIAGDKVLGVIAEGSSTKRKFEESDKFISAIAHSLSTAIENSILYEQVKEHAATLEQRVSERTEELNEKNVKLTKSQNALLNLVDKLNKAKEELSSANKRLKEIDSMKSMFIASTSHELRTPLNSIIGFSSILLEGWSGELTPEQKEQLEFIHTAGTQLLALINDVIDISKIEAGKLDTSIQEFKLKDVVDEAITIVQQDIDEKNLSLHVDIEDTTLATDRRRLLQCILNILSNAVKFTEKGEIRIKSKSINNKIDIHVTDTGIGIKKEDMPKLFTPFVRFESPLKQATKGTGLGLYLSRKLAEEALQGSVDATSEYNKGSTFTLHIPVTIRGTT